MTSLPRPAAYACLALSMALVGCYVALSKPLVAALPVFLLGWLRFGIGGVAMLHWLPRTPDEAPTSPRTRVLLFLESLFGNFLFSVCMLYGVSMTSAVSAGVILSSIPAVVAVMSWIVLRERIDARVAAGVLFAVAGIGLLSLSKSEHTSQENPGFEAYFSYSRAWMGNALVVGAVMCESAYAVIGKQLTGVLRPKRIAALINLWGFALMTPLGAYFAFGFDFAAVPANIWILLVFYAMAASVWTVWLWMTGLRSVPAAQSGVFTVMLPITAAAAGVAFLGESFTTAQGCAFALALVGVLLATWPARAATVPPLVPPP